MDVGKMDGWMVNGWRDVKQGIRWSAGVTGCIATKLTGP